MAVGFWFGVGVGVPVTLTITSSALVPPRLSVTVRRNVSATFVVVVGAVKLTVAVLALLSVTAVPETCVQAKLAMVPSGSVPVPVRLTAAAEATVRSAPALATGFRLAGVGAAGLVGIVKIAGPAEPAFDLSSQALKPKASNNATATCRWAR